MSHTKQAEILASLIPQIKGCGIAMSVSNFVEINLSVLKEFKKLHIPQKQQAEIVSQCLGKKVSVATLAVAMSRLNQTVVKQDKIIVVEKNFPERFVDKNAKLILGAQKEKTRIIKNGVLKVEESLIDWRGLAPNEKISNWILEYKDRLIAINLTGWRWKQIVEAVNEHLNLSKKISVNTLTSLISLANKKIVSEKE